MIYEIIVFLPLFIWYYFDFSTSISISLKSIQINEGFWSAAVGKFDCRVNRWLRANDATGWRDDSGGGRWIWFMLYLFIQLLLLIIFYLTRIIVEISEINWKIGLMREIAGSDIITLPFTSNALLMQAQPKIFKPFFNVGSGDGQIRFCFRLFGLQLDQVRFEIQIRSIW